MKTKLTLCTFFVTLSISQLLVAATYQSGPHHPHTNPFTHIFQFGDSISDTGNLIREAPFAGFAYTQFPYGLTLGRATGRASDGWLMVDYIADHYNLPHLSPYLDRTANFTSGVNFAVASSTALSTSQLVNQGVVPIGSPSSLSVQMGWFMSHLDTTCHGIASCKASILRNSLILMGEVGGNDYNSAMSRGKNINLAYSLVPQVIKTITEAIKEVIHLGATRIVVPGNFAIGCMPVYLNTFRSSDPRMYDEHRCLRGLNDMASYHNNALQQAIKQLQENYPGVVIVYADYYNGLKWVFERANSLGFSEGETQRACCGDMASPYGINLSRMCGMPGAALCPNPSDHVSWDGIHLTGHAYQRLAAWLLYKISPHLH